MPLVKDYLRDVFGNGFNRVFSILDVLAVALFFWPNLQTYQAAHPSIARWVGIAVLVGSLFLANLSVYRKLRTEVTSLKTSLAPRLEILVEELLDREQAFASEPLDEWVVKLRVANKGGEVISFAGLAVELTFDVHGYEVRFRDLVSAALFPQQGSSPSFRLWFSVYCAGMAITGWPPASIVEGLPALKHRGLLQSAKDVWLSNWDAKQAITMLPFFEYPGPKPGEVEHWVVHGRFPLGLGEELLKNGYHLARIEVQFFTDHGDLRVRTAYQPRLGLDKLFKDQLDSIKKPDLSEHPELAERLEALPFSSSLDLRAVPRRAQGS